MNFSAPPGYLSLEMCGALCGLQNSECGMKSSRAEAIHACFSICPILDTMVAVAADHVGGCRARFEVVTSPDSF